MLQRILRTLAATVVATAGLVGLSAGTASAAPCPGGESPCVYLPAGTYSLGNPVTYATGSGPTTIVLLRHCNSTGTTCDELRLNLPGLSVQSAPSTLLTLTVPGEGAGLSGITPVLYLGLPGATPGSPALGLTVHVQGTTIVLYDTVLGPISCGVVGYVPANPYLNGTYSACGVNLTATL
jgi:hypothetical protein